MTGWSPSSRSSGSYWWLIFPVMGVMASVGSAWERGARRRHRRRLEVLKAKAELKSAQAAARGRTGPVPIASGRRRRGTRVVHGRGDAVEDPAAAIRRLRSSSACSRRTTP